MKLGKLKVFGFATACSACIGLNAMAQQPANSQTLPGQDLKSAQDKTTQPSGTTQQGQKQHENLIASCLVHDNQAEVALGRMAQEKAQSDGVKKFAGMMVQDHQEFLNKLQRFAPNAGQLSLNQNNPSDGQSRNDNRDTDANPNRRNVNPSGQQGTNPGQQGTNPGQQGTLPGQQGNTPGQQRNAPGQQVVGQSNDAISNVGKLQHELAQQCLSDAQAKLSKAEGEEFDKCYVGMQIAMHAGMKSKLTVFSKHASGEFKQLLDQAKETTTKHLEHAESLMKELDGTDSPRTERRPNERTTSPEKSPNR